MLREKTNKTFVLEMLTAWLGCIRAQSDEVAFKALSHGNTMNRMRNFQKFEPHSGVIVI